MARDRALRPDRPSPGGDGLPDDPRVLQDGRRQATAGAFFAGVGLGGFLDGIVLHQILQWHHMLSSLRPPETMELMRLNMFWDGLFHAAVWVATVAGVVLLWRGARRAGGLPGLGWLVGWLLIGWGAFNGIEGLTDHHVLRIHHVRGYGPDPLWDYGFLLTGPVLVAVGWWLARDGSSGSAAGEG